MTECLLPKVAGNSGGRKSWHTMLFQWCFTQWRIGEGPSSYLRSYFFAQWVPNWTLKQLSPPLIYVFRLPPQALFASRVWLSLFASDNTEIWSAISSCCSHFPNTSSCGPLDESRICELYRRKTRNTLSPSPHKWRHCNWLNRHFQGGQNDLRIYKAGDS